MNQETFKITDQNEEWHGQSVETEMSSLEDKGSGKPIILRTFDFTLPPGDELPLKEDLLNFHKSKITAFLWRDELVPIQKFKLIFSKDKKHFRIFATCQGKAGSVILEKPELISNIIHGKPN